MNHVYFIARLTLEGKHCYRCYDAVDLMSRSEVILRGKVRPVHIRWGNLDMDCVVDTELTVFPGVGRDIHFSDGSAPARVIYEGPYRHRLVWDRIDLEVHCDREYRYKFFLEKKHLATMIPVNPTDPIGAVMKGHWTPRYTMMSRCDLPGTLASLMLHFPMLQIGY